MENILINIDSSFREEDVYSNSGKFTYKLSENIKNCKYIRLSSIEIPNLFYTFTQQRNNISFIIEVNNISYNITINEGNYTCDMMIKALKKSLKAIPNNKFNINLNYVNGLITICNNNPFTINFCNNNSIYKSLGYHLGFRNKNYTSISINIPDSDSESDSDSEVSPESYTIYSITSEAQLDIIGDHYLFLKINNYGIIHNDYNYNKYNNIQGDKNILAKIILQNMKCMQNFDNGSNYLSKSYIFRQPININRFDIELIDMKGNTINMMSMNYSLTLELGIITDSNMNQDFTNNNMINNMQISGLVGIPNYHKY
jgi:hypothetical protein